MRIGVAVEDSDDPRTSGQRRKDTLGGKGNWSLAAVR